MWKRKALDDEDHIVTIWQCPECGHEIVRIRLYKELLESVVTSEDKKILDELISVGEEAFAPDFEFLFERVKKLFEHVKSGVLINEVRDDEAQLRTEPLLGSLIPFIYRAVYINTPDREVTIAVLADRLFGILDEDTRYYALLMEEVYGKNKGVMLVECTREQFLNLKFEIDNFFDWYRKNISRINKDVGSVLDRILSYLREKSSR